MRPTLRLENPIDTSRTLAARRSSAFFPGAGGFGWLLAVLGSLAAPGSGAADAAGAEPLLEGRVLLSSGPPVAGARVRLFVQGDLGRSLRATADESGYFAFPLKALRRAAPLPARLHLGQNYPNPFNPSTIIPYQVPVATRLRLEVFNILGQRVATLVDGERPAGFHTATWNATDASGRGVGSGVYLYRLLGGGERLTRSMVLLDGPGVPGGGGGSGGARASARGEEKLYGLIISGPGLVPYVDPAFRVGAGPVEIQVETLSRLPRAKVASGVCWATSTGTAGSTSPTPCSSPPTARIRPCPLPTATSPWETSTGTARSISPTPGSSRPTTPIRPTRRCRKGSAPRWPRRMRRCSTGRTRTATAFSGPSSTAPEWRT